MLLNKSLLMYLIHPVVECTCYITTSIFSKGQKRKFLEIGMLIYLSSHLIFCIYFIYACIINVIFCECPCHKHWWSYNSFIFPPQSAHMLPSDDEENGDSSSTPQTSAHSLQDRASSSSVPDFPRPAGREFILRNMIPRPAPYSKPTPQRMYCVLVEDDFRLAGAFTEDTTFQWYIWHILDGLACSCS